MTRYFDHIEEKISQAFSEEHQRNDWNNCYKRILGVISTEIGKSFWNGVKHANRGNGGTNAPHRQVI